MDETKMVTYFVNYPVVYKKCKKVKAKNELHAIELILKGKGENVSLKFSHIDKPKIDIFTGEFEIGDNAEDPWFISETGEVE